jgi:hypothetical protein
MANYRLASQMSICCNLRPYDNLCGGYAASRSSLPSAIYSCVLYHYIIEQAINKGVMIRATQQPRDKKYDGKSRLRAAWGSAHYISI